MLCLTSLSCSKDDDESSRGDVSFFNANEELYGVWIAEKAIINGVDEDSDSCALKSSIVIDFDFYSDKFYSGEDTCTPIFVNGTWTLSEGFLTFNYNDGRGEYLTWEILELTGTNLSLKSTGDLNELWKYYKE